MTKNNTILSLFILLIFLVGGIVFIAGYSDLFKSNSEDISLVSNSQESLKEIYTNKLVPSSDSVVIKDEEDLYLISGKKTVLVNGIKVDLEKNEIISLKNRDSNVNSVYSVKEFIEDVPVLEGSVLEGSVVMGDPNAEVTVYEFTDYECPFCAIAEGNAELVEQFKARYPDYVAPIPSVYKNYVANDKIRYVFYNFPIVKLHPLSMSAHLAAMCANEQGKWKEFNDALFEKRGEWSEMTALDRISTYKDYAKELSLDSAKFDSCLDSKKYEAQIEKEIELGKSLGVSGTPGFFVNRVFISGAQDYATFEGIIESELSK